MNRADDQAIRALIANVEAKDKRFRIFQGLFMGIVSILLIVLVGAQFFVIKQFQDQSAQRAAGIKKIAQTAQHNTELSNQYLQCIARFFATTDRQSRILTDLDNCVYEQNGAVIPGLDSNPTGNRAAQEPVTINPNGPGLTQQSPSNTQQGDNSGNGGNSSENPPVEILGIPVCVPFTNVCVR